MKRQFTHMRFAVMFLLMLFAVLQLQAGGGFVPVQIHNVQLTDSEQMPPLQPVQLDNMNWNGILPVNWLSPNVIPIRPENMSGDDLTNPTEDVTDRGNLMINDENTQSSVMANLDIRWTVALENDAAYDNSAVIALDEDELQQLADNVVVGYQPPVTEALPFNPICVGEEDNISEVPLPMMDLHVVAVEQQAASADESEKQTLPEPSSATLTAWPNPTFGAFQTRLEGVDEGQVTYQIVGLNGQVIHAETSDTHLLHFDLTGHSAGVYYLQAFQNGKIWRTEVLLQR
jgi:hypothetical protein